MFVALVVGTAASLAPPPLAKLAIDDGHRRRATSATLDLVVVAVPRSARSSSGARPTRRPTSSAGSASARCRTCASSSSRHLQALSVGFYSRRQAGVLISRLTNDVQALDQLVSDGVVTLFGRR